MLAEEHRVVASNRRAQQAGRVLLQRTTPIRPTTAGETVLRLARQIRLLDEETARALDGAAATAVPTLPIAVNADSLATWFLDALVAVARQTDVVFDLRREDQERTAALLRDGGANGVVVSSEAAGRLLGVAASSPSTGAIFEDLLVPGQGLELAERDVLREEVGLAPRACRDLVVAVLRDGDTTLFNSDTDVKLRRTDRVVVVRGAEGAIHAFENRSEGDAKFLAVVTPGALGPDYFEEISAVLSAAAGGPPDPAAMGEVMRRHGLSPATESASRTPEA